MAEVDQSGTEDAAESTAAALVGLGCCMALMVVAAAVVVPT